MCSTIGWKGIDEALFGGINPKSWANKWRVREKVKGSGCVEKRVSISGRRSGKIGSEGGKGRGVRKPISLPFPSIPIRRDACESAFSVELC